ncbi:MAG: hypothetical protein AABY09_03050, partial [Nanoarchaeota archaeon]
SYSYKKSVATKLITYNDTFFHSGTTDVLDSRQKTYYDTRTLADGTSKFVQVQENFIGLGGSGAPIKEGESYTYWKDVTAYDGTTKTAKITENYLSYMDGLLEKNILESKYYAYNIAEDNKGKLVLERFEGIATSLNRVSVEKRYTALSGIHAATVIQSYDPEGTILISQSFTWKQSGGYNGEDTGKVVTVTASYATNGTTYEPTLLLTTEYSYKEVTGNVFHTITKTRETASNILTSIRDTYRVNAATGLPTSIAEGFVKFITVTKVWEAELDLAKDPSSVIYTYKVKEDIDSNQNTPDILVNYTDSYITSGEANVLTDDIFDSRQKTYYAIKDTVNGDDRLAQVQENFAGIGDGTVVKEGESYTY